MFVYSILCKDCNYVYMGHTKIMGNVNFIIILCISRRTKKQYFFVEKKTHLCWNMLVKPTMQLGGTIPKLLPPAG